MGETYIIFGEAKIEDLAAQAQANAFRNAQQAASAMGEQNKIAPADKVPEITEVAAEADGDDSTTEVEEKDVELVMTQVSCTRAEAVAALKKNKHDIVEAIMSFEGK